LLTQQNRVDSREEFLVGIHFINVTQSAGTQSCLHDFEIIVLT